MFERNEQEISQIIEENLEGVLSGKTSVEEVLRRYPQHAVGLRRELEAVLWLNMRSEQVKPRPGFISASRKRVVERVKQEARSQNGKHAVLSFGWPQQRRVFQWAAVVVVLILLVSGVGGLVSFSQTAIPGQQLYGVKRISEQVALGLAVDPINKVELSIQINERRLQEVEALVASGDMTRVHAALAEFSSGVEQSVALLQQVDDASSIEKVVLAKKLTMDLAKKADRLASLAAGVPGDLQADLIDAQDQTLAGATSAMTIVDDMNQLIGTSTPTGTTVPENLLPYTATVVPPSKTPRPTLNKTAAKPGLTKTPQSPQKKATLTPRPTNPNRPTDSGHNPTKEPKPPKEDKPTRDDKPTKTDKNNK